MLALLFFNKLGACSMGYARVSLSGVDRRVPQQRLAVPPRGPGVEPVGGVSMAQLVGRNLFLDTRLLQHPPPVGAGRLRREGLAVRLGENRLPLIPVLQLR